MADKRSKVVAWVGSQILPHETDVRSWLKRTMRAHSEIDDIIQEAYCRLAALDDVTHIAEPRAYFFQVARNVVLAQMRRARVVRIETVTEIEALEILDEDPSPERIAAGRWELARVQRAMETLPARCRRVVELRKIRGLSQRAIAQALGISENVVENEAAKGVRLIVQALTARDGEGVCIGDSELKAHGGQRQRNSDR